MVEPVLVVWKLDIPIDESFTFIDLTLAFYAKFTLSLHFPHQNLKLSLHFVSILIKEVP